MREKIAIHEGNEIDPVPDPVPVPNPVPDPDPDSDFDLDARTPRHAVGQTTFRLTPPADDVELTAGLKPRKGGLRCESPR